MITFTPEHTLEFQICLQLPLGPLYLLLFSISSLLSLKETLVGSPTYNIPLLLILNSFSDATIHPASQGEDFESALTSSFLATVDYRNHKLTRTGDRPQVLRGIMMRTKSWEPLVCRINPRSSSWCVKPFACGLPLISLTALLFILFHFLLHWTSYYSWNAGGILFIVVALNLTQERTQYFLSKSCVT